MFTGITEQVGQIESLEHTPDGEKRLPASASTGTATTGNIPGTDSTIAASTKLGDSISVNGCCLTVVEFNSTHFSADLSGRNLLRRTNFAEKKPAIW